MLIVYWILLIIIKDMTLLVEKWQYHVILNGLEVEHLMEFYFYEE